MKLQIHTVHLVLRYEFCVFDSLMVKEILNQDSKVEGRCQMSILVSFRHSEIQDNRDVSLLNTWLLSWHWTDPGEQSRGMVP